jgi:hypothetical protein
MLAAMWHQYHHPLLLRQAREYSKNPLVIFKRRFRPQLAFSIIIPICQQLTGISTWIVHIGALHNNALLCIFPYIPTTLITPCPPLSDAIMFFSPVIFKSLGFGDSAALVQTVLIGTLSEHCIASHAILCPQVPSTSLPPSCPSL